jgi:hypothetical protein
VVLPAAFILATVAGVTLAVRGQDWSAVQIAVRPTAIPFWLAAFTANLAGLVLAMASWRTLLVDIRVRVPLPVGGVMFAAGLVSKYIPGRVWGLLVQIQLGRSVGLTAGRVGSAYFVSLAVGLASGATVGLLAAPAALGGRAIWLAVPVLLIVGLFAWPNVTNRLAAVASRVRRRPSGADRLSDQAIRRSITFSLASWLVSGLHLWVLVLMFHAPAARTLPLCVGGFALAMVVGSLAVVLPDGWGLRELVLTLPLATVVSGPAVVAVLVASRVVVLLSEVVGAGLTLLVRRWSGPQSPSPLPATVREEVSGCTR